MSEPDPTPEAVRAELARLLGWDAPTPPPAVVRAGVDIWLVGSPDGRQFRWDSLPDPAADLNAMAAVEAVLRGRGLGRDYAYAVVEVAAADPAWMTTGAIEAAVMAPPAARALAAYRVIAAAKGE